MASGVAPARNPRRRVDRVWWVRGLPCEMKSVPVLLGDTLWIHGYGSPQNNKGRQIELPEFAAAIEKMDKDGDKLLNQKELTDRRIRGYFPYLDLNQDGQMDAHEWSMCRASFASVNAAMAIRVGGKGDMTDKSVLWRYYRSIPQLPSPLITDDTYYMLGDQGGLVTTLDPTSGELRERGRVGTGGDAHFASPVAADGKVYLLSESGVLAVLAADRGLEPLHQADFGETCFATPSLSGGSVWVRTMSHLYRLGTR